MSRTAAVLVMLLGAVAVRPAAMAEPASPPGPTLDTVAKEVQQRLTHIAGVVRSAAAQAPTRSRDPKAMETFLASLAPNVPNLLYCAFLTPEGVVTAVAPGYGFLEGADLAGQPWVRTVLRSRKPTLGQAFLSLEGIYAVPFVAPAIRDGRLAGLVSVVIDVAALLDEQVEVVAPRGAPIDVWVMEPSGRLLFDPDQEEVGKNLLDDPMYAPFAAIGEAARRVAAAGRGTTGLTWTPADTGSPEDVTIAWRSVSALGASWRVVVARPVGEGGRAARTLAGLGTVDRIEALRRLAADPALGEAVLAGLWQNVQAALARYYSRYPCYAVQWVDPGGLVRGGHPPGNALSSYQLNPFENPFDAELLAHVQARVEATFETPLAEGRRGTFHVVPVLAGETFLGVVYALQVH
jgi:hypothetical protein